MSQRSPFWVFTFCSAWAGVSWVTPCAAHIDLLEPVSRDTQEQKTNPCAGSVGERTEFEAGSTITVRWTDTIPHPGWYVVSFDSDGDDFDGDGDGVGDFPAQSVDAEGTYSNGDGSLVLADQISLIEYDGNRTAGDQEVEVTLPDTPCEECTLQLIQVMDDEGHAPSEQRPSGHIYFRCADVRLVAPAGGTPDETDAGLGSGGAAAGTGGAGAGGESSGAPVPSATTPSAGGSSGLVAPPPAGGAPGEPIDRPAPLPPASTTTPPVASSVAPTQTALPIAPPTATPPASTQTPAPTTTTSATASAAGGMPGTDAAGDSGGDEGGCSFAARHQNHNAVWISLLGLALVARRCARRR